MDNGRPFRISRSEDNNDSRPPRRASSKASKASSSDERPAGQTSPEVHPQPEPVEVKAPEHTTVPANEPAKTAPKSVTKKTPAITARRPKFAWKPNLKWVGAVVFAGVVLVGAFLLWQLLAAGPALPGGDKYQAVTTTDGQIFFGKVKPAGNDYVEIIDGYYLQPASGELPNGQPDTGKLVMLSNRLYGPSGDIVIAKNQILSFEVLDPDGQIVQMMGVGN